MRPVLGLARVALPAALLALLMLLAPSAALADHVRCGDVLTQDTRLDGDVVCGGAPDDPLTGVSIAAGGLTLDLNGFTIRGPNAGEQAEDQWGVRTSGELRSVTIKNGTLEGFSEALSLALSEGKVHDLGADGRIRLSGSGNVIRDSEVSDGDTGLEVRGDGNRILRNVIWGGDGDGIFASGAGNRLIGNTAIAFQGAGIRVEGFSDVLIRRNDVSGSFGIGTGLSILDGSGGVVSENVANDHDSSTGIYLDADNLLVRGNRAHRNDVAGLWVRGFGNVVKQNVANDNNPESLATYGIRVEPGNVDGGGNRASGNGAPDQCLGVRCR